MTELSDLLELTVRRGASDLHLRAGLPPLLRLSGRLEAGTDQRLSSQDVTRVVHASMNGAQRALLEAHCEVDYAIDLPRLGRFRVNAFRTMGTDACVMRRVAPAPVRLEDLGLPAAVRELALRPRGLVLVTGPTGSGKSTTLTAMVDAVNRERSVHVLTIEDPVEVLHPPQRALVTQRELGGDTPDWSSALRAAVRQDPDVILIGELRDAETVHAAVTAAETGHLVLASMHTIDARETVNRLVDFFPAEDQQRVRTVLAGNLEGVVCQRLVSDASGTGRICVMEIAVRDARWADAVGDAEKTHLIPEIVAAGGYSGMQSFDQHLMQLLLAGEIDLEVARRAASSPHDLSVMLRRAGWAPHAAASVSAPVPHPQEITR